MITMEKLCEEGLQCVGRGISKEKDMLSVGFAFVRVLFSGIYRDKAVNLGQL